MEWRNHRDGSGLVYLPVHSMAGNMCFEACCTSSRNAEVRCPRGHILMRELTCEALLWGIAGPTCFLFACSCVPCTSWTATGSAATMSWVRCLLAFLLVDALDISCKCCSALPGLIPCNSLLPCRVVRINWQSKLLCPFPAVRIWAEAGHLDCGPMPANHDDWAWHRVCCHRWVLVLVAPSLFHTHASCYLPSGSVGSFSLRHPSSYWWIGSV